MIASTMCPGRERLQGLLDGAHDDPELSAHLDICTACQSELERLAHGHTPLAFPRPAPEPTVKGTALHRIIDELKDHPADLDDDDFSLDFLTPSDRPESLGRFGAYEVEQVVGRGGMGIVLKALDADLNRIVAIKVIAPQLAVNGAMRRRFVREARAAAAVCHEHVVTIHHVDTSGTLPYLVMQYVPGPSLQERLDRNGPLELKEILRIGMQTAAGLASAHAQGLIHRDVKPANILLEDDMERVKLTDFGLARAMDDVRITQSAVLAGTPQYMAPEQARGETLDYRADLFSLGSVLYTMCVGRPPFRGGAPLAVLKRVCEDTPRSIREQNPNIPAWLEAIVMKLLEKDPAARFQNSVEVSALLGRCLAHVQQPKLVRLPAIPRKPKPPRSSSWRRPLAMAAAFLALLVCGLGATVITVRTSQGTLVIEVDDPGVKVTVEGDHIIIIDPEGTEIRLRPGDYKVKATKDGKLVDNKPITIKRGEKTIVTIRAEQPAAAGRVPTGGSVPAWDPDSGKADVITRPTPSYSDRVPAWDPDSGKAVRWELKEKAVTQAAFSADGKTIATGTADGTVHLLDAATGKRLTKILAHRTRIRLMRFLPDRKLLITVSDDGEIKVWDMPIGWAVSSHDLPIKPTKAALSPDGKVLAGAAAGQPVRIWDITTGKELAVFKGDPAIQALAFSPDGKLVATGTPPGTVRLWDAATGKAFLRMEGARTDKNDPGALITAMPWITQNDQSIAFSPDGKLLASATGESVIRLWDVSSGKEVRSLSGHDGGVGIVAFSPDGRKLASASEDKSVLVWDVKAGTKFTLVRGPRINIISLSFSPDGRRILTVSTDGSVELWHSEGGPPWPLQEQQSSKDADKALLEQLEQARLKAQEERAVAALFREEAAARLEALRREQYARAIALAQREWEANGAERAAKLLNEQPANQRGWEWHYFKRLAAGENPKLEATTDMALRELAFSPDGRLVAIGGADGKVQIVYASSPGKGTEIAAHGQDVQSVAFSPEGKLLATASTDDTARLWDAATGKPVTVPLKHQGAVHAIAFSPDGRRVATASADGEVKLWDVSSGKIAVTMRGHRGAVFGVAFSPDGKRLASVGFDRGIRLWDAATGKLLRTIVRHTAPVIAVRFSPDGKHLASGSLDKTFRVFDPATGEELFGHGREITAIAYSPNGSRLASASVDKMVELWDTATGQQLLVLKGHTDKVTGVAFSPDGKKLATCGADKRIIIYDGTPKEK